MHNAPCTMRLHCCSDGGLSSCPMFGNVVVLGHGMMEDWNLEVEFWR